MRIYGSCVLYALFSGILWLFSSCSSARHTSYFQDVRPGGEGIVIAQPLEIRIQPEDRLSILVNSRDPQLTNLFNLPIVSRQIGQDSSAGGSSQGVSGYTIDSGGEIDFPVLGKIRVAGKNREEIAAYIKKELIDKNYVKDPVVTVEFANLCVSVLGEVNNPGRFRIERDQLTLLDALSMAGDLTIYGKRDRVLVLRKDGNKQRAYEVNLCSADLLYASPAYHLQQNDVVYVEPNPVRARQSTVNGNNVLSTSFWFSLASLLTTVSILIFK